MLLNGVPGAVRVEPVVSMSLASPPQTRVDPEQLEEAVVQVAEEDGESSGSVTSR